MNPLVPHRRRRSDTGSISYVVESLPGEDLQSDYEEETQGPSDTRTSKQPRWSKRGATKGYARDQPCQDCFTRMIDNGPENLCSSQAKAGTTACYRCARLGNKCQLLSPHLLDHGARLQSAACRIMNGQPVENWDQLVIATRNALRNDVVAKPKVTPRAQSSKGPASVSAHAFPQVQLRPSRESPPRQGPPEVQDLPQLAAASQSPSDTTLQQILAELTGNYKKGTKNRKNKSDVTAESSVK
ncbi:hypothetical protein ACHAQI_000244 [Fusarium lateritium]